MDKFFGQRRHSEGSYKKVDFTYISSQKASLSTGCDKFFSNYINALLKDGGLSLNQMEKKSIKPLDLLDRVINENSVFENCNLDIRSLSDDEIRVDTKQIEFVFSRILDNALKYSEGKVPTTIQVEQASQALVVSFKDSGIGIDPFEKDKIFQPFYRGIDSAKFSKGIGLGLTLSHEIIKHHDADIRVESVGRGLGTSVYVSFPFKDRNLTYAKQASRPADAFKTLAY